MQPEHRKILIELVPPLFGVGKQLDFQHLLQALGQTQFVFQLEPNLSFENLATRVVDAAIAQLWIAALVEALAAKFDKVAELKTIIEVLAAEKLQPTSDDPFEEVWLESDRPFVNRVTLRGRLRDLITTDGSRLLLVDGAPKTGKSFSYYLLAHAATHHDFLVNRFELAQVAKVDQLADDILHWIGASSSLPPQGNESAVRWAEKLAAVVANSVTARACPRVFVFDTFPGPQDSPLPDEICAFIVRLARWADQESHGMLRVVLVRFPGELPPELDDVAARDEAQPFTISDMLDALAKIKKARKWSVGDDVVNGKINEFEAQGARTLRDRFKFLRTLVQDLAKATKP